MRYIVFTLLLVSATPALAADSPWHAGFAKVEATPTEPVRMSGYGNRDHPSEGVDTPLYVRAVALRHGEEPVHVLVSIDTIGLPGSMVRELTQQIEQRHRVPRQRIVVACTHTHTGPDLVSELSNIFSVDLTEAEIAAGTRYRKQLGEAVLTAVKQALQSMTPAALAFGQGQAAFAANRRVIKDGRWTGFGVQPDGPVDHSVPVLRIDGPDGNVRGVIFNYACHCTTLDGNYYRINADWAGYAAADLEAAYPGSVALCTIGCGADANPEPRGSREASELHGRALSREVKRIVGGEMEPIDEPIAANFSYAGLSFNLPTIEELRQRSKDPSIQVRRHAEHFQKVFAQEGRLPATYPVPIQSWRFGDKLTMIFLGGEVVADYALRLKRELRDERLWVTAYANDVLGYIASERIRAEGGYEYDVSGIYYNLPGPWAAGTEDLLIRRIRELFERRGPQPPLEPDQASRSISVPPGYKVQLVAAEPLVVDPINFAFGHDGSLWVVEMGDYPLGGRGSSGRVKRLSDTNRDGVFDQAAVFLDGLDFPTGVHPWRDGVIVIAAPDIFFARDRDSDGRADEREVLYSGLARSNPQHRANGFAYGLDHSLHCAAADNIDAVTLARTGETVSTSGHDLQIWPDSGRLAAVSGRSQYIRSRNDWGDWFGSDNSRPMYHYPIEDRYLARNAAPTFSDNKQQLFSPPVAPPVYPLSETIDRFNDLFAANRFTSACSAIVIRSSAFGKELEGAALVCEPVHNLVHRAQLAEQSMTYRATRAPAEQDSEFMRSSDPWFRPVRAAVGPDGMIWVADMYRAVIEHPEWIPQAWQRQIDMRAGSDRGRIYRIVPTEHVDSSPLPVIASLPAADLVALLASNNGTLRDMAQQELLQRGDKPIAQALRTVAASSPVPAARVHALWTLHGLNELHDAELLAALRDSHAGVVRNAILLVEPRIAESISLLPALLPLVEHSDPKVKLQLALTLGESKSRAAGEALAKLVPYAMQDLWLARAIVSSSQQHSLAVLEQLLSAMRDDAVNAKADVTPRPVPVRDRERARARASNAQHVAMIADLIATAEAAGANPSSLVAHALADANKDASWVFPLAAACTEIEDWQDKLDNRCRAAIQAIYERAKQLAGDDAASIDLRRQALRLFGNSLGAAEKERTLLSQLLAPTIPLELQLTAVERLTAFRDHESARVLLSRWTNISYTVRDTVALQLTANAASTQALISALESGEILPSDLSPAVRQTLRQSSSQSLQARINRVLGNTAAANQDLIRQYLSFQETASEGANLSRGRALFDKHCAACHIPDAAGRATGPNLSNLTDRSRAALTEAVLAPNRSVEPQYHGYIVQLVDGRVLTGIIADEAGNALTLHLADGRRTSIQRSEIEDLHSTGVSLMPEGMQHELDPAALFDLIEYVRSGIN